VPDFWVQPATINHIETPDTNARINIIFFTETPPLLLRE
jgi:hypothetical protein